jgi:hypothetical protein
MFQINYEVLEEEKNRITRLRNISELDNGVNTVVGQFQLVFNNNVDGFVDKDIPYDGEFLIIWFRLLNDVLMYLKMYKFATIYEPDTDDIWLEFNYNDSSNQIKVKQIRVEKQACVTSFIEKTPRDYNKVFWQDSIKKDEFYNTIIKSTGRFIEDILSINELMSELNEFKELEDRYIKSQGIIL